MVRENSLLGTANNKRSFKLLPNMSVINGRLLLPMRWRSAGRSSTSATPLGGIAEGMVGVRERERENVRIGNLHDSE